MRFFSPYGLAILGALLAAIVVLGALALHFRDKAAQASLQRDQARQETQIVDKGAAETRVIIQNTERAAREVERIPSDRIPDDVRAGWLRGLGGDGSGQP